MSGPAVLVVGAGGGCGTSLVAGALALCWSAAGRGCWLLDLDLDRGDLAAAWGLPADRTIADLAPVAAELAPAHVRAASFPHPSGVTALCAPGVPGAERRWEADGVARLVRVVAGEGTLVIDGGSALCPPAAAAAGGVRHRLVVCRATVASARRARRALDEIGGDGARVVLNPGPGRGELSARALGRALGAPVAAELPWAASEAAVLSAGGWPRGGRARLRAAVEALAEGLA
ncbi:MAG: hypothetical protein AB7V42_14345 [Thermoleophilia bacterium]